MASKTKSAFADKKMLGRAIKDSFIKLNPKTQVQNPVMLLVYISAILTSGLWIVSLFGLKDASSSYTLAIAVILWFTCIFANFAEAIAEGRGKAQADAAANLQLERTKAKTAYQDAIQQAIKDNDARRAQALYEEAQRIDDNLVSNALNQANLDATRSSTNYAKMMETAQTLAQYGDFSGYLSLGYSQDQVDAMRKVWEAQNAELVAKMNGTYVPSVGYSGGARGGASGGRSYSYDEPGNGGSGRAHYSVTHNDIDYTNPEAVQNAVTASDTIRAMIKRGDSISDVNAAITKASQGGLISDDAARRLRYTNNSRA